jgi:peptidoglycan/xylan/chitin deacetylase (PgdA/CDA1 family)
VNFVLNVEEGGEPSVPDGDARSESGLTELLGSRSDVQGRDLAAESMFEYGARVGAWRVLRQFTQRNVPFTAFACALALERNPEFTAALLETGVDFCAHGHRWERHYAMDIDTERAAIDAAVASLERTTGERPQGWYCRYGPSLATRRLLLEKGGFLYDSDSYADELPYWVELDGHRQLVVPYSLATNDTKFARSGMATASQFFEFLRDAVEVLYDEGAQMPRMMSIGLHSRLIGHPGRVKGLALFLDWLLRLPEVWITRRVDIARHWAAFHPPVAGHAGGPDSGGR